jgi:small subunit ribosomal protein S16
MAVKMRLMRMGKKKAPSYRVVVVDGRSPRDGRYIEQIGRYDPQQHPSLVEIDNEKASEWLSKGAQPTEAVEKLLNISGALNTLKLRTGQIHTVGASAPAAPPASSAENEVEAEAEEPAIPEAEAEEPTIAEAVAEEPAIAEADTVADGSAPEEDVTEAPSEEEPAFPEAEAVAEGSALQEDVTEAASEEE